MVTVLCLPGWVLAQSMNDLSSLPSTRPEQKLPNLDEAEPAPKLPEAETPPSISIPRLRSPEEEEKKSKSDDWAAQAMKEKQEAAKKKQEEDLQKEEAKARQLAMQESTKPVKKAPEGSPAVSKSSTDNLVESDKNKLPAVTGIEGVKPRASASDDGRVQPSFDSFTGPSSTSPMGKDYQSGAKPIMPPGSSPDGRMLPPKAPEPPSGAYKKISQDPNATVPPSTPAKTNAPSKLKLDGKAPPPGNPLTPGIPAGLSPYDNTRNVPDPRSTRRF